MAKGVKTKSQPAGRDQGAVGAPLRGSVLTQGSIEEWRVLAHVDTRLLSPLGPRRRGDAAHKEERRAGGLHDADCLLLAKSLPLGAFSHHFYQRR